MASGSGTASTSPDQLILSDLGSTWDFPRSQAASEQPSSGTTDPRGVRREDSPYLTVGMLFGWINAGLFLRAMGRVPPRVTPAPKIRLLLSSSCQRRCSISPDGPSPSALIPVPNDGQVPSCACAAPGLLPGENRA